MINRKRIYSSGGFSVLKHPTRIKLYELISKGVDTTPKLADVLGENRVNLYHHLSILEKHGLIISTFEGDRIKKFNIIEMEEKVDITPDNLEKMAIKQDDKDHEILKNSIIEPNTVVINPPKDSNNLKKFQKKLKELLKIVDVNVSKNLDFIQLHLILQSKESRAIINKKIKELENKTKI